MNETDGKAPTIRSFMRVAKIGSKDLAARIINSITYELEFKLDKAGHQRQGALSLTLGTDLLNIELHVLCLQWPSRPIRFYRHQIKLKYNVTLQSAL